LIYYFTHSGRKSYIQVAELTLNDAGKIQCDRNKYRGDVPPNGDAPGSGEASP
jgi:hypothetical protein